MSYNGVRFIAKAFLWFAVLGFYLGALINLYGFFVIITTGDKFQQYELGIFANFIFPIIILLILKWFGFHENSILYPIGQLSVWMLTSTQIAIFIMHLGFEDGSSIVKQATFLIAGLLVFLGIRWSVCEFFYKKYELLIDTKGTDY